MLGGGGGGGGGSPIFASVLWYIECLGILREHVNPIPCTKVSMVIDL